MILVVGATGTVGSHLVTQLIEGRYPVRVFTRNADKAAKFGGKVEVAVGDLDDAASLARAFDGIERFFLLTASTNQDRNALSAARVAGARHVVKLSTQEAGWTPVEGHGHWHKEREEIIRASGLAWTFLRPCMFMNFALSWAKTIRAEGAIYVAGGEGKLAPIDPMDVAAVARAALTKGGHEGVGYELTGPEVLGFDDMAAALSSVIGRDVRRVQIPGERQGQFFAALGLPKYVVDGLLETLSLIAAGRFAYLTDDVERVTGVRPRTFAMWAQAHADAFGEGPAEVASAPSR